MNFDDQIRDAIEHHTAGSTPPPDIDGIQARSRRRGLAKVGLTTAAVLAIVGASAATAAHFNGSDASDPHPPIATHSTTVTDANTEYAARATVLEGLGHGPQLCVGGVADSLPPQCGGPDLVGWDWDKAGGADSANGTTWGDYVVFGTYNPSASTFTLTRPAIRADDYDGPKLGSGWPDVDFTTPCDPPPGGWAVIDPAKTTEASQSATFRAASQLDDYAEAWVDQSINPADPDEDPGAMNDPAKLIINVRVTGSVSDAETALRQTWGGALCVSQAQHTSAELHRIQDEVSHTPDMVGASTGNDQVELIVIADVGGALQQQMDENYGPGLVKVYSALQPAPPMD